MVSSEQVEFIRKLDLVSQQKANTFNTLFTSVDVVSEKKVLATVFTGWTDKTEETEEIYELTVDVAEDFNRSLNLNKHWLLLEQYCRSNNQELYLLLGQDLLLNNRIVKFDFTLLELLELAYDIVQLLDLAEVCFAWCHWRFSFLLVIVVIGRDS